MAGARRPARSRNAQATVIVRDSQSSHAAADAGAFPSAVNLEQEAGVKALAEGLYIKHFQYGCGVVTQSDTERTTIDFDAHGTKKFVTSMMVVEPAEGAPPKRSGSRRPKKAVRAAAAGAK